MIKLQFTARFVDDGPFAFGPEVVTTDPDGNLKLHPSPGAALAYVKQECRRYHWKVPNDFFAVGKIRWLNVPEPYASDLRRKGVKFEARIAVA